MVPGRRARLAVRAALLACLPLAAISSPAAANGIGDLYVATAREVLEVRVDQVRVVNAVDVPPVASALAFSNDGHDLFVASNRQDVARIDIATISPAKALTLPRPVSAVAVPKGTLVVAAMPDTRTLAAVDPSSGEVTTTVDVPGGADLLAASRRDGHVLAAESGASWVACFDPVDGSVATTTIEGAVAGIVIDRAPGTAWVVTRSPDRLVHLRLPGLAILGRTDLPESPADVASMAGGVVVAGARSLWHLTGTAMTSWGEPSQSIVAIAASDDGKVLLAAETDQVEAFTASGHRARQLQLAGTRAPLAIAPIPAPSSLDGGTGLGFTSATDRAPSSAHPASSHMPVTATEEGNAWIPGRAPLAGAVITAGAILVAYGLALRLHESRRRRRRARVPVRERRH